MWGENPWFQEVFRALAFFHSVLTNIPFKLIGHATAPIAATVLAAEAGRPHCGLIAILLLAPAAEGTGRGTAIAVGEQRR